MKRGHTILISRVNVRAASDLLNNPSPLVGRLWITFRADVEKFVLHVT